MNMRNFYNYLVVLSIFLILLAPGCTDKGEESSQPRTSTVETESPEKMKAELRFDGFYQGEWFIYDQSRRWNFLRFYKDGMVLGGFSEGPFNRTARLILTQGKNWPPEFKGSFQKNNEIVNVKIGGESVNFTIAGSMLLYGSEGKKDAFCFLPLPAQSGQIDGVSPPKSLPKDANVFCQPEAYEKLKLFSILWGNDRIYEERASAVTRDLSGNIYIAGKTRNWGSYIHDKVLVMKFDKAGRKLWSRTWGSGKKNKYDWANAVAVDGNDYIYVAGVTQSGVGSEDALLLKYDSGGKLLWAKAWGGKGLERARGVGVDPLGFIYVTSSAYSFGRKAALLKFDPEGNLLWARCWGGKAPEHPGALVIDTMGNIYVGGETQSYATPSPPWIIEPQQDWFILKYDGAGKLLWGKTWGESRRDVLTALALDARGYLYAAGTAYPMDEKDNSPNPPRDAKGRPIMKPRYVTLLKLDSGGNILWSALWDAVDFNRGDRVPAGMRIHGKGDIFIALKNAVVLKYSKDGVLLWSKSWETKDKSWATFTDIDIDAVGAILISGYGKTSSGDWQDVNGSKTTMKGVASTPTEAEDIPQGQVVIPVGTDKKARGTLNPRKAKWGHDDKDVLLLRVLELGAPSSLPAKKKKAD
ncbi:MAG: hypothetical protein GTO45_29520 [Candidatus Aminicenantes bacterium]|nr:hypothetical protein [Candidatus Aminicenantes bacterium]NIM82934.1 hypothetical protein [Candidatus Aminicenantes bacterium]NIN22310.1 hypothetical protein [Candidatus Aminicenantes bacterium]NIN46078.1 hypothetical protein [Candidatus Aminicenantes bacterium]NIN88914.1 hypothetical protein [Candidatus Aminicenantes bacterium]